MQLMADMSLLAVQTQKFKKTGLTENATKQ
jgi:hypothetical protein